ncbi:hypothetical protein ACQP1W_27560 [Spirillospora sp. CA-255316]
MPEQRVRVGQLHVAAELHRFLTDEALPGSGVRPDVFWSAVESIILDLTPRHRELLGVRESLQARLDDWHRTHPGAPTDTTKYHAFLVPDIPRSRADGGPSDPAHLQPATRQLAAARRRHPRRRS